MGNIATETDSMQRERVEEDEQKKKVAMEGT
jgi:hypothetical protein